LTFVDTLRYTSSLSVSFYGHVSMRNQCVECV